MVLAVISVRRSNTLRLLMRFMLQYLPTLYYSTWTGLNPLEYYATDDDYCSCYYLDIKKLGIIC